MHVRKLEHTAIDQLEATPEILRLLMTAVTEEQVHHKPSPDRWSIAEVLEHLSHVEGHVFRIRLDRMIAEQTPELDPYDEKEFAALGTYSGRDPEESVAHWEEQRDSNIERLRGFDATVLTRTGRHLEAGVITVDQLLNQWASHDLSHVRQITELVRMGVFYPGVGPFQMFYSPPRPDALT